MPTRYARGSASYGDGGKWDFNRSLTTTCDRYSELDGRSRPSRSVTLSRGSMSNSRRTPPRSATHASFTPSAPLPDKRLKLAGVPSPGDLCRRLHHLALVGTSPAAYARSVRQLEERRICGS